MIAVFRRDLKKGMEVFRTSDEAGVPAGSSEISA